MLPVANVYQTKSDKGATCQLEARSKLLFDLSLYPDVSRNRYALPELAIRVGKNDAQPVMSCHQTIQRLAQQGYAEFPDETNALLDSEIEAMSFH